MLFEVVSSALVGSFIGYTYFAQNGLTDDGKKIARICANSGLSVKDDSMQLLRRSKRTWGVEYAYRIPLGLSFKDFERAKDAIQDGLNAKQAIDFGILRELRFGPTLINDIKRLLKRKKGARKEVELSYDGVLCVKVYAEQMTARYDYTAALFDKLNGWEIPVGTTRTKLIRHDFDKHCHLIVAGMTDYGKSVFLKNIITTLVARKTKHTRLYLVDLKGGLAFNRFRGLEQVDGLAKNPEEALEILTEAQTKMNATIEYLLQNGFEDVKEAGFKERHFVIIDEAADISGDKACQAVIRDIARRGRGAGFRLVYATQYPTNETLSPQVRQNCSARLTFRLNTVAASMAVIDEKGAEDLPLIKGRAIYVTDRKTTVQTPMIENKFIEETLNLKVNIRGKGDGNNAFSDRRETAAPRRNTLIVEEVGIS
ncbi:FtsK/SpoIIIE domain-containing protein [Bacillus sp. FSL K6-3431]|uniref:FtsK/SpoIIIE domain-containing protein n=1 Tax=Bacillus sp. FSL K6-3431 TaxID=2921500 RepID=UPI0030F58904